MRTFALALIILAQAALIAALFAFVWWNARNLFKKQREVPFIPTPRSAYSTIFELLDIRAGDIVYDLGSGDGRFLFFAAAREPLARFVGIERNILLHAFARIRLFFSGLTNVELRRGNLFDADISDATKIYTYLFGGILDRLQMQLEHDFRGRLVSRAFIFSKKAPSRTIELPGLRTHGEHTYRLYEF